MARNSHTRLLPPLMGLLCAATAASAADTSWNAPSGDWAVAGNWTGGVPVIGDAGNHYIENDGTATISGGANGVGELWLGNCCGGTSHGAGTLVQSAGTLGVQTALHIGNDGRNGSFYVSDASVTRNAGSGGAVNIMRGSGGAAAGTFSLLNSTVSMGKLTMAVDNDSNLATLGITNSNVSFQNDLNGNNGHDLAVAGNSQATINLNSGTLSFVGAGGNGALNTGDGAGSRLWVNQTGGTFNVGGWLDGSRNATAAATWSVSGGTLNFAENAHLGLNGQVTMLVTGGVVNHLSGRLDIAEGRNPGHQARGLLDVSGTGVFNTTPSGGGLDFFVGTGDGAVGTVTVHSGGAVNKSGGSWTFIGTNAGSTGYVNVNNGGTFTNNDGYLIVANNSGARGSLSVDGGQLNMVAGRFVIGQNGNTDGTLRISGGTFQHASGELFQVGGANGSRGTLDLSGGVLNTVGDARVGDGGNGTVNHSSGTWTVSNWLALSEQGTATSVYNQTGGVLRHTGDGGNLGIGISNTSTYNLSDGTVHFGSVRLGVSGGGQTFDATVNQTGGSMEAAALTIGEQNANARYNLSGGFLKVDLVTLGSGDTLAWGDGTLTAFSQGEEGGFDRSFGPAATGLEVMEGRVIDVAGALTTGDGVLQSSTLRLNAYELNGIARFDQLAVSGDLDLAASDDVLEFNLDPMLLAPTDPFEEDWGTLVLVDASIISGQFSDFRGIQTGPMNFVEAAGSRSLDAGIAPEDLPLNTWYIEYSSGGDYPGDLLFHYHISQVPEPTSLALLALGAVLLRARRR